MSTNLEERNFFSDSLEVARARRKHHTDKKGVSFASLIDTNMNFTTVSCFYKNKDDSRFKKRIEKLNMKFYAETEKYLNNTENKEKCQDQMFLILFKQISLYIEEVERLNTLIFQLESQKSTKETIAELNLVEREKTAFQHLITNLKQNNTQLKRKLIEKNSIEEKLKMEIESLKRQVVFYKEKVQLDLMMKKLEDIYHPRKHREERDKEYSIGKKKEGSVHHFQLNQVSIPDHPNVGPDAAALSIQKKMRKRRQLSESMNTSPQESSNTSMSIQRERNRKNTTKESHSNSTNQKVKKAFSKTNSPMKMTAKVVSNENSKKKVQGKTKSSYMLISLEDYSSQGNTCMNLKSPTFGIPSTTTVAEESNINTLHESLISSIKYFDDEIGELNELEKLLGNAKCELTEKEKDCFIENNSLLQDEQNDSSIYNRKNYPLSDGEDSRLSKQNPNQIIEMNFITSISKKIPNANVHKKKNYPLLASVTIDLTSESQNRTMDATGFFNLSSPFMKTRIQGRIKRKTSDVNSKSDNASSHKKKGLR